MKKVIYKLLKHFLILIIIAFAFQKSQAQNQKLDSLLSEYYKAKHDTNKINLIINKLGLEYEFINKDSAIHFYNIAVDMSVKLNNYYLQAKSLQQIGYVNLSKGDFRGALEYFLLANESYLVSKNNKIYNKTIINDHSKCLSNIGISYSNIGDYDKSLDFFQRALSNFEQNNELEGIGFIYNNIGLVHFYQKNFSKAIEYFNKSIEIKEKLRLENNSGFKLIKGIGDSYNNLGMVYESIRDYINSLSYYQKGLENYSAISYTKGQGLAYNNIGIIYLKQKDLNNSENYFNKSLEIKLKIGDESGVCSIYANLSNLFLNKAKSNSTNEQQKNNYLKESIKYGLMSFEIAKRLKALPLINIAADQLKNTYKESNQPQKAIEYAEIYISNQDSLFGIEKTKSITEMETKYQTEKKQQEIEKQNLELGKQNAEIQKQTILRNSFIGSFLLILIIAIVIYRNFHNKKKANILLSQQKTEIEQQKEEIESQRDELQTSNLKLEILNSELEKLSIVASETDNSVVITDERGEIEWVNEGFTRLFEYTKDEFIEKFGSNIKKASKNKDIENAIKECIKERKTVVYITLNQTKSGKTIWTQTTLTPIIKDNSLIKLVAIDSDISKLKEAEEEIKQQKEELEAQSELLIQTNNQLELKNTQITDSIRYAKQIQDAMLPVLSPKSQTTSSTLQDLDFEAFVFFKPKDIVSGDFYWFTKTSEYTFIAVADCTGHGVPGAFMSMIGNILLNEIITQKKIYNLSEILTKLDEGVNFAINKQNNSETSQEDGMEISICRIDTIKNEIEIASTNQSVYIFNDNELTEIEGGLYSIGGSSFSNKTFESHIIKIKGTTNLYLLSDGYQDQFGGENRKKFGSLKLKELIKTANEHSFSEQKNIIESEFNSWIGNNKQIDDVTILGININSSI